MSKKLKILLLVIASILLLFSVAFLWKNKNYELAEVKDITTDSDYVDVTYNKEENIEKSDVQGILYIDKIGLIATVKEGSTKEILKEYIGHISETAKYDGNIGLAAHNRGYKNNYFMNINKLQDGDEIIYRVDDIIKKYKVEKKIEIDSYDWSYLNQTADNRITLITCIDNSPTKRLVVQAVE